ncbi:MAG: hypothetical protein LBS04_05715, partial [Tannerellaceae bacterium]|nr:hypothetical protein [Tannerellaceae bacterium]
VITEETPVIDGNNYTKGKGKGKEIKKEKIKKENLAIKNLEHEKEYGAKPQQPCLQPIKTPNDRQNPTECVHPSTAQKKRHIALSQAL